MNSLHVKEQDVKSGPPPQIRETPRPLQEGEVLRPLRVCVINPRYEPSFWGYDFALPLQPGDKRCWMVSGTLPALAALAPAHCTVELVDENVEEIDFDNMDRFDVIGVTGMVVQAKRMHEILHRLRGAKGKVIVGGPYCSVAESQFKELCDTRFIGEAEETWPEYLIALGRGEEVADRYEQAAKSDMEKVPTPRYDLVKSKHYAMASLQFSRGCPFLCEFCDIITIFGRRPRMKTNAQMIAEFEAVRDAGFRLCFLVDDNFIGNKAKAKDLLRALVEWQKENGYPLKFVTEASINLADEPELMALMVEANIVQVFIGIESPRASSLSEIQKIQNVRGDSQMAKLQRIRDNGIVPFCGFIVGFDNDDEAIFDEQYNFIQEAGVALALVAMLTPIPTTPLYDRLKAEGRLDYSDSELIFHPKNMSRETLKRGYADLMQRLYTPEAFFERLIKGYARSESYRRIRKSHDGKIKRNSGTRRMKQIVGGTVQSVKLARVLSKAGLLGSLGRSYVDIYFKKNRALGRDAIAFGSFVGLCMEHWHFFNIANGPRRGAFGAVLEKNTILFEDQVRAA
jgi:radical SAM superfamily enzyme YgiQ (UPF0313 family)